MDFTGAQMILTLKLISTAVSYQDGLRSSTVRISDGKKSDTCQIDQSRS